MLCGDLHPAQRLALGFTESDHIQLSINESYVGIFFYLILLLLIHFIPHSLPLLLDPPPIILSLSPSPLGSERALVSPHAGISSLFEASCFSD